MNPVQQFWSICQHCKIHLSKFTNIFVEIALYICPNCLMYLSKLQNVFVQIKKCICPNCKMYLSKIWILCSNLWIIFCLWLPPALSVDKSNHQRSDQINIDHLGEHNKWTSKIRWPLCSIKPQSMTLIRAQSMYKMLEIGPEDAL